MVGGRVRRCWRRCRVGQFGRVAACACLRACVCAFLVLCARCVHVHVCLLLACVHVCVRVLRIFNPRFRIDGSTDKPRTPQVLKGKSMRVRDNSLRVIHCYRSVHCSMFHGRRTRQDFERFQTRMKPVHGRVTETCARESGCDSSRNRFWSEPSFKILSRQTQGPSQASSILA